VKPRRDVVGSGRVGEEALPPGRKVDPNHASPLPVRLGASRALREHWPEYLIEAVGLGIIMLVSASVAVVAQTLLPAAWPPLVRRMVQGLVIAGTGASLVYSPWGMRSGAHFNPSVTLTFLVLGRVRLIDAAYYMAFQVIGGVAGISIAGLLLGSLLRDPPTLWIVTRPGAQGALVALVAEFVVAFVAMATILVTTALPGVSKFTGALVAALVFLFISFESPLSGFSMNPARSFGSAAVSGRWTAFWIYVLAPPSGMLAAALLKRSLRWAPSSNCAKLFRNTSQRCIHCGYTPTPGAEPADLDRRCKIENFR
jgi:aquaporin Z